MNSMLVITLIASCALISTYSFLLPNNRWVQKSAITKPLFSSNPDLFSDDLFEDDEEGGAAPKNEEPVAPSATIKKKYLDEDWQLSKEDQKDFKGFVPPPSATPSETYPVLALMYEIRRENTDGSLHASIAEHKGHCDKFKRLINSEVINTKESTGIVLLWVGLEEDDMDDTRAEIMQFMEEDPLITKDMVDKWDIIDLGKKASKDLPAEASVGGSEE